jgi:hypothetical protein
VLQLEAHGDYGQLYLSGSHYGAIPLVRANADVFDRLRPYFNPPYGAVYLHGCGVGSATTIVKGGTVDNPSTQPGTWGTSDDSLGYQLLKQVAKRTRVGAMGAINAQMTDGTFRGPRVWVYPDGGYCLI